MTGRRLVAVRARDSLPRVDSAYHIARRVAPTATHQDTMVDYKDELFALMAPDDRQQFEAAGLLMRVPAQDSRRVIVAKP